jgi:hypothetical protein
MAPSKRDLAGRAKDRAKAADKSVEAWGAGFELWLGRSMRKILSRVDLEDFGQTAAALNSLMSSLRTAGLNERISDIEMMYADELKVVRAKLEPLTDRQVLADVDYRTAETMIDFRTRAAVADIEGYVGRFSTKILDQVVIGAPVDIDSISEGLDPSLVGALKTEIRTELAVFQRTITAQKAEEFGIELFAYLGPDDGITRDFCAERVNQVFTIEEIRAMDNGQGFDVFTFGGGYNCRHDWNPVTLEIAIEEFGYQP